MIRPRMNFSVTCRCKGGEEKWTLSVSLCECAPAGAGAESLVRT